MAGPAPPRNRGRLVLVLFGIAAGAAAAWLLVRAPQPNRVDVAQKYGKRMVASNRKELSMWVVT